MGDLPDRIARVPVWSRPVPLSVIFRKFEPGDAEEVIVRDRVRARNVAPKEILEALARHLFDHCTYAFAIVVKLSLAGILIVHATKNIVQRFMIIGRVTDREVQQYAE